MIERADHLTDATLALDGERAWCLDCDYPLRALPAGPCPECGRAFDPADEQTFNPARPVSWLGRRLHEPVGWPTMAVAVAACAGALWLALDPSTYYTIVPLLLIGLLWVVCGGMIALRRIIRDVIVPWPVVPVRDRRVRRIMILLAATSAAILLRIPLWAGFLIARPGLERLAVDIDRGAVATPFAPRRIGPYWVGYSTAYNGNGVLFLTTGGPGSGFAYNPKRLDPLGRYYNSAADGHLIGPWYWWTDD